MKKTFFLFITFTCLTLFASAQEDSTRVSTTTVEPSTTTEQPAPQKQKAKIKPYYGLTFGLSFGNYTRFAITPMVGFPITQKLSIGGKIGYEYINDTRNIETKWNNYGASVFGRYRFIPRAYAHVEYAYYNYSYKYTLLEQEIKDNTWVPLLFVGGGYVQPVGNNVGISFEVLFDVLQNENSPYGNWDPIFSIGAQVGF